MVDISKIKVGNAIEKDGAIYKVLEIMKVQESQRSFVRSTVKNLRTGSTTAMRFLPGEKVAQAIIEKNDMMYSYNSGDMLVFMNNETYEQMEIPAANCKDELKYMTEGMSVITIMFGTELLGIELPDKVTLEVKEAAPAVKGDTKTNASKDAVLETGHTIKVPMFIETGERIIVSTQTGDYVSREK